MGKRPIDPTRWAAKWRRNMEASTNDIRDGVNAVTEAPTKKAAARVGTMKARFIAAVDSGKVAAGLNAVGLEDWRRDMLEKGLPRISEGAAKGEEKTQKAAAALAPQIQRIRDEIDAMPNATEADRKARMLANFDKMKSISKNKR